MHDRLVTRLWFFMHDGPEVISSAFVSPLLAVFQGNDFFQFKDCAVEKLV